ncbi:MAG TPA: quinone oxidoreductase [Ilumatobacter sp.]
MWGIRITEQGGPEVLEWVELPDPSAGPGQIVVEVAAAGLNFIDIYQRSGLYTVATPFVPGLEGAGTVSEVGDGVTRFSVGDRVAWTSAPGSYAGKVAMAADAAIAVPPAVDLEVAAALMLQGMTAHFLATSTYPLGPGDRCLVHAGAGGVGRLLIQIAKMRGAEVFATVGSAEKAELATAAGADYTIRYRDVDFAEAVVAIAGERPLDVVFDGVGKAVFAAGLELLRPRGMMVTFGNASGPVDPVAPLELTANGSLFLTRPTLFHYVRTPAELQGRADDLFAWVEAGELDVLVGERFALRDAADAQRALAARATVGKVLLMP